MAGDFGIANQYLTETMASTAKPERTNKNVSTSKRGCYRRQEVDTEIDLQEPMLIATFSASAELQSSSLLLSLPAELRTKIPRKLLRRESMIVDKVSLISKSRKTDRSDAENIAEQKYIEQTTLSAQILACCQQLCLEGRHILDKWNKFGFSLQPSSGWACAPTVNILNYEIDVPRKISEMTDTDQSLYLSIKKQPFYQKEKAEVKYRKSSWWTTERH